MGTEAAYEEMESYSILWSVRHAYTSNNEGVGVMRVGLVLPMLSIFTRGWEFKVNATNEDRRHFPTTTNLFCSGCSLVLVL